MSSAPSSAPRTSPRPPKRLTPPITAEAIAFSSRFPGGNVSPTELTWAAKTIPPIAAIVPESANTMTRMRGTLMPARRADVVVGVVDPAVLDDDRAARLQRIQDHTLEDQKTAERDDERGNADERDDRALHGADHGTSGDGDEHREEAVHLQASTGKLELRGDHRTDAGDVADREVDLAEEEHEDDAVREQRRARRFRDQVDEVDGREE